MFVNGCYANELLLDLLYLK